MPDSETVEDVKPLAVQEAKPVAGLFASDDPVEIIEQATKRANALMQVVRKQGFAKNIQGREYLQLEAWQTLAALSGVTPFCEWSKEIEGGWEARVVVRNRMGVDIAAAEAQCTRSERTWASRDEYALRSMAQTRAAGKALRSCLSFIAVLAGFEATPAEEMPEKLASRRAGAASRRPAASGSGEPRSAQQTPNERGKRLPDDAPVTPEALQQVRQEFVRAATPTEAERILENAVGVTSPDEITTMGDARIAYDNLRSIRRQFESDESEPM